MNRREINRRNFLTAAGLLGLMLAVLATPGARSLAVTVLVDSAEVAERVVRFPCWVVDHSGCFSLDRLDPTCPQCM